MSDQTSLFFKTMLSFDPSSKTTTLYNIGKASRRGPTNEYTYLYNSSQIHIMSPSRSVRYVHFIWKTARCVETMKFLRHLLQSLVNDPFLRVLVSGFRPWRGDSGCQAVESMVAQVFTSLLMVRKYLKCPNKSMKIARILSTQL